MQLYRLSGRKTTWSQIISRQLVTSIYFYHHCHYVKSVQVLLHGPRCKAQKTVWTNASLCHWPVVHTEDCLTLSWCLLPYLLTKISWSILRYMLGSGTMIYDIKLPTNATARESCNLHRRSWEHLLLFLKVTFHIQIGMLWWRHRGDLLLSRVASTLSRSYLFAF